MKKDIFKIAIIFLVTVVAVFWALNYLFLTGKTAQKSKAGGETIEVSYDPSPVTAAAGQDFTVFVRMKPSLDVSLRGYSLRLKFDKTVLQAKYVDYKIGVYSTDLGDSSGTLAQVNQTGVINLQGEIQNSSPLITSSSSTIDLVRLVFTAVSATGTTVFGDNAAFYTQAPDGTLSTSFITAVPDLKINGGSAAAACTSFSDDFSTTAIQPAVQPGAAAQCGGIQGLICPTGFVCQYADGTTHSSGADASGICVVGGTDKINSGLNQNNWDVTSTGSGTVTGGVTVASGEATIAVNGVQGQAKTYYLVTKNSSNGDFSAEVLLKSLVSTISSSSANMVFSMAPVEPSATNNIISVMRKVGSGSLLATNTLGTGNPVDQATANLGLSANSLVKVKIQRAGTVASVFYDISDGQGYKLLKAFNNVASVPVKLSISAGSFESDYPQVTAKLDNFNLACAAVVNPTNSLTPTIITMTGTVTGNVKLNMKLKFQGIGKKPADSQNSMIVKVKLKKEGTTNTVDSQGTFAADADGVWTGQVGFNITDVSGKWLVYVKGPQHLQKKICDSAPSETAGGRYSCSDGNITLAVGENSLDFTKVTLLVGDLDQNGLVDSVDFGLVKNNLGKKDAAILAKADLNRDGVVDTQDFSLILAALAARTDEQ